MFAAKRDRHAVHKNRANPDRKKTRLRVRRYVGDVHGIEYYKIRKGAGPYQAAIKEVELRGWHSGHSGTRVVLAGLKGP